MAPSASNIDPDYSLRRRFQQNQEDCTFTVLALLPTATENIVEALPVESITQDLQQKKAERLGKNEGGTSDPSITSGPRSTTDDDGRSLTSFQSESYVHASQTGTSTSDGKLAPRRTKAQLWNELKINGMEMLVVQAKCGLTCAKQLLAPSLCSILFHF